MTPDNMMPAPPEEIYLGLRDQLLSIAPEDLGLEYPDDMTVVFGVVMDWSLGAGIVTLYGLQTGDASFYTSSGGGTLGGIGHESVRNAAIKLVERGQMDLAKAKQSDDTALPAGDVGVRFYFLTNKGRFVADEQMKNFESGQSPLTELFSVSNDLITELRLVTPQ